MPICRSFPVYSRVRVVLLFVGLFGASAHAQSPPVWLLATGVSALASEASVSYPQPVLASRVAINAVPRSAFSPIQLVMDLANRLRDIRYKRGGREPSTGFDCSGFVRYVFRQGIGAELPNTSAAQFRSGQQIARNELRSGDLVFFRTAGKRISHVGIYVGDGEFIHAPSTGKRVSVSRLSSPYWAHRFVGAKRPQVLAAYAASEQRDQG